MAGGVAAGVITAPVSVVAAGIVTAFGAGIAVGAMVFEREAEEVAPTTDDGTIVQQQQFVNSVMQRVQGLKQAGSFAEAEVLLNEIVQITPGGFQAMIELGESCANDKPELAQLWFQAAAMIDPISAQHYFDTNHNSEE